MKAALNEHLRESREAVGMGELHLLLYWNPFAPVYLGFRAV
jgi:hypothetical protein